MSDADLVKQAQAGDADALQRLLVQHEGRIFAVCLRMVGSRDRASDLTQDAFVKIIQGLGTFDGRASFTTWMTRVTMNHCLSHLRKEKLRRHASLDAPAGAEGSDPIWQLMADPRELGSSLRVEDEERMLLLDQAIRDLEPEQRAILILRDVRELDYKQIAQVLDVAVGTVKSRLFRARATIRERVEQLQSENDNKNDR